MKTPEKGIKYWTPRAIALGFLFFWLLPTCYVAWFNRVVPGVPGYVNNMYSISALFPVRASHWSEFYVQYSQDGQQWQTIDESVYSRMKPFGNRTRFKRMLEVPLSDQTRTIRYLEMVQFAVEAAGVQDIAKEVRLVQAYWKTGPELAAQKGPWKRPALDQVPTDHLRTIGQFNVNQSVLEWAD